VPHRSSSNRPDPDLRPHIHHAAKVADADEVTLIPFGPKAIRSRLSAATASPTEASIRI